MSEPSYSAEDLRIAIPIADNLWRMSRVDCTWDKCTEIHGHGLELDTEKTAPVIAAALAAVRRERDQVTEKLVRALSFCASSRLDKPDVYKAAMVLANAALAEFERSRA